VGEVAPSSATRATARAASDRLFRGIISASSEVSSTEGPSSSSPSSSSPPSEEPGR